MTLAVAALVIWAAALVFFRTFRIWLPYYLIGSVGLATALIYFGRTLLPMEHWLKLATAGHLHQLSEMIGVRTELFTGVPGALLVLVISQDVGWTVIHIDIECSGLLESAVLIGLLAFYPGLRLPKKLFLIAIGIGATYAGNLIRMLAIVGILHWGGKDTLFISHTVVGRALFFAIVVFTYWFILTRTTLNAIDRQLRGGTEG